MGTKDEIAQRIAELQHKHDESGVGHEEIEELLHLIDYVLAERDVLMGMVRDLLNQLIDERTRAVAEDRKRS